MTESTPSEIVLVNIESSTQSQAGAEEELSSLAPFESSKKTCYDAFISYRHCKPDEQVARLLQDRLETYRVPAQLSLPVLRRRLRVFRDSSDLSASGNLPLNLREALSLSEFLVVICSSRGTQSDWVRREIEYFMMIRGADRILPLLIEGEPAAAFPPPLDPQFALAADVRAPDQRTRKKRLFEESLRIIAPILGVEFDKLRQRDNERAIRRLRLIVVGILALMIVVGTLGGIAFWQRRVAERRLLEAHNVARVVLNDILLGKESAGMPAGERAKLVARVDKLIYFLDSEKKADPDLARLKGSSLISESDGYFTSGKYADARIAALETIKIDMKLWAEYPGDQGVALQLSSAYMQLSRTEGMLNHRSDAERAADRAMEVLRKLALDTGDPAIQWQIATGLANQGSLRAGWGDFAGAEAAFRDRLKLLERLRGHHPDPIVVEMQLAFTHGQLGTARRFQSDIPIAITENEQALAIMRTVLRDNPAQTSLLNPSIASCIAEIGHLETDRRAWAAARRRFDEALKMYRNPQSISANEPTVNTYYLLALMGLAESSNGLGDYDVGLTAADEVVREVGGVTDPRWGQRLLAAGLQIRAVALAGQGKRDLSVVTINEALSLRRKVLAASSHVVNEQAEAAVTYLEAARIHWRFGERAAGNELARQGLDLAKQGALNESGWLRARQVANDLRTELTANR